MWAEAFFEVFTTVLLAWFMYMMGFIGHAAASRIVYLATLLFLGSGLLGISHNFYWNAKPVATLAIGSVFSTLQVVPLILLTLEAWQFRRLPRRTLESTGAAIPAFGQEEAFLFLLGVNFWNFVGAGLFGFMRSAIACVVIASGPRSRARARTAATISRCRASVDRRWRRAGAGGRGLGIEGGMAAELAV